MFAALILNSTLMTMYLIAYRITSGVVLENPWLVLHLFSLTPSYFLFCLKYVTFSGYWALRKRQDYFSYMSALFSCISHWKGRARCVSFSKNVELIYITYNHVCLPSCLSDMPVCTPNVCLLSNETLIFVFPDLLKFA